jgi:putative peptide zinc metalloprotease protein
MGALFLCLSPCLYCNVSDAWTLPSKWKRIIISYAGIYVELLIAALATFYWWNSKPGEFWHELAQSLMIVCSISTVMFNANPLMRFDGYYVLADWLEIPNLRDRSNKFLSRLVQEHCLGIELHPEPYMSTSRKVLFVTYAITSYIYRWVITFSILYFFYRFLEPYKLGAVSMMLAVAAAASMFIWPVYRLGKNIHRRGRLPDMKRKRVTITMLALLALVAAFLFLPLPVFSRVREIGMVQLAPEATVKVHLPNLQTQGLILDRLDVYDGQRVSKGHVLARFRSIEVENQLEEARSAVDVYDMQIRQMREQKEQTSDLQERGNLETKIVSAKGQWEAAKKTLQVWEEAHRSLTLKAPRDGTVMSCPKKDEVGKRWEQEQSQPFCAIGDPVRLQVLLPVPPADHRLLREELDIARGNKRDLPATIRVQGFAGTTWAGRVDLLHESEAREVPPQLTTKFGGPLAVKQTAQGGNSPQSQHYLVSLDFLYPDTSIHPGTLAMVKIHCRPRSCAWWTWRAISSTFDLGLI